MTQQGQTTETRPPDLQSKFSPEAGRRIVGEASYLFVVVILCLTLIAVLWWAPGWLRLDTDQDTAQEFQQFVLALLGGTLGGAAFATKWLYHSVGAGPLHDNPDGWTVDRRLWRFFVPVLSGVMSVALYAVLRSGLLNLEIEQENRTSFAVAFGFIVGYFSDRAAAKLREVARVLFGEG